MSFGHNGNDQLALCQRVHNALRFGGRTALYRQPPRFGSIGDQRMIGTALATPAAVFVGPLRHLNRVNNVVSQGGHHNGHGGGPAAVAADVVCAVGRMGPAFVQLVEIDDFL